MANNLVLLSWSERAKDFTPEEFGTLFSNLRTWLAPTADRIILGNELLKNANNPMFADLIDAFEHNIDDETGEGDPQKAHAIQFVNSYEALSQQLFGTRVIVDNVLDTSLKLDQESFDMFSADVYEMLGACMAQEAHALPQLLRLFEGCTSVENQCSESEWYGIANFYDIHLDGTERRHAEDLNDTVWKALDSSDKVGAFLKGYDKFLNSLEGFWKGIENELQLGS